MYSAHSRNAMTLAGISSSTECVLGKRHRDDEDEDKENREEVEPCKRQCIQPISVGSFFLGCDFTSSVFLGLILAYFL